MKKSFIFMVAILALMIVACGGQEPEPAAPSVEEAAEEVMEEESMEEESMEEESMEEESMEEESMEEESMEEHSDDMADSSADAVTYIVDPVASSVRWTGAKAVGDTHVGTIQIASGEVAVVDGNVANGLFSLDMTTIANEDLSGGMRDRLEGHLKSEDFFAVDAFPTAELVIVSATNTDGDSYDIVAELTIKGITEEISFTADATADGETLSAAADFVFDRAAFDVQFGSGSFFDNLGDDLINDEVAMNIALVATTSDMASMDDAEEMMEEDSAEEMTEEEMDSEMADDSMDAAMDDAAEVTYAVNVAESAISWTGAKAAGSSHTGSIDVADGSLVVAGDALVSGSFVIDMTTISYENARLEGHLKDDDFFGVDTFPTASLVILSAEPMGDNQYAVVGDLTIKEITHPIEFVATATQEDGGLVAQADMVFDRALYDVQYGSGSFFSDLGNDLINDEVEISVTLVAAQ